jgi:glycosyltransferase involved in cell wall biosynthesis
LSILFIGKRFYTNRDTLRERFGRIYQLPWHWAEAGISTRLWLIDYHTREIAAFKDRSLDVVSTPAFGVTSVRHLAIEAFGRTGLTRRPELVVASGDCYIGLMAYHLAKKIGAHFVFDVYDKYDEFSGYRRFPWFDPFTFLLRHSDFRLFASQALMESAGYRPEHDFIVPNGVDTERFQPMDMRLSRRECGLPEESIFIGYFGSMEPERGIDDLISAVQHLRTEGLSIELLLGGKPRENMDLQQSGIRYVGNVPFDRMPAMLASCDLLSVPYRRSAVMDAGASNKIAEAMACRRPLVATRTPNLLANFPIQATLLNDLLAKPGDVSDIACVIRRQLAQRVIVDASHDMDWPTIAANLAAELSLFPEVHAPLTGT